MSRVGAETLLKVYGVEVDPEEFAAFAGMGEVSRRPLQNAISPAPGRHSRIRCAPDNTCICRDFSFDVGLPRIPEHLHVRWRL